MLTKEDLKYRETRIGASDAPIIMGISEYKTPLALWEEKHGLIPLQETTRAMQLGNEIEDEAREFFYNKTGIRVKPSRIEHSKFPWMFATLDGISDCGKVVLEIKRPKKEVMEMAKNGIVRSDYFCQMQHQSACVKPDEMFYLCYHNENYNYMVDVNPCQDYIDTLLQKEKEFYRCLMEFSPPEATERDYTERTDETWTMYAKLWKDKSTELKRIEKEEKQLRETLIELSGKSNSKGASIRLSRTVRKGAIVYDNVPELIGVDLEPHRKPPIEFWRITNE